MNRASLIALVCLAIITSLCAVTPLTAASGDPQIRTDHPWYPGELAISTFDRLFATQAELYQRVTGLPVDSDQSKALASWYWRNTHYWHGETGKRDLWGSGSNTNADTRPREYWNGLFGFGFGLCGTTHSQWTAELEHLLGHGRGRGVGAAGHNAFEVFLTGGPYGPQGQWALLDHDLSTVIFDTSGRRLLGLDEMQPNVTQWIDRGFQPDKQHGWLVCGLHPNDGESYRKYAVAEYLAGYAGPPPIVELRRGERMRRYFAPGLADGKTFVFWGRNYNTDGIPGPERSRTWVNQPEKMHGSKTGTPHRNGQARFANVEYVYQPDFTTNDYREAAVREDDQHVVFSFQTPYVIAATPPNDQPWGIYDAGCTNGLVLNGQADCDVAVSTDAGRTWLTSQPLIDSLDLTDQVKGHSQYWLRFSCAAAKLRDSQLTIRTVCQANVAVLPRLKDNGTTVQYAASGQSVLSMGPEFELAKTFLTAGDFGQPNVTLTAVPDNKTIRIHAAAHVASGSPPDPKVRYQIQYSHDDGKTWRPIVADWTVPRRGIEPNDFWSQSLCYGEADVQVDPGQPIQIRFTNDGGKRYLRAEAHLIEYSSLNDPVKVTYDWTDSIGNHQQSHVFGSSAPWHLDTASDVLTHWVEMEPFPKQ
ncbi:hypothetical protein [Stieleria varia]|uniref:BNR/Asp-box repeat protein n=1 Tax=Stieleria varia TaxID=2528005 RepID=A0A5C6A4U0_9BACT|nr:hypothetical protein [Stieleria varia]TWT94405.1 hypothetical protein Pla52n_52260 [Stieleria varia]